MVKLVYSVVEECGSDPDVGEYVTYGIMGERVEEDTKESIDYLLVHDVTTKRNFAERMAKLFEQHQLSLIHLREVIEDILCVEV